MSAPWPSGPGGQPLPVGPDGQPVWPSPQYRRDYEQALAQQAVRTTTNRRRLHGLIVAIVAVVVAVVVVGVIRDLATGGAKGQQEACQFYRDNGIDPPADQNCP